MSQEKGKGFPVSPDAQITVSPNVQPGRLLSIEDKDPKKHYRFVRNKGVMADSNVDQKTLYGYTPVKRGGQERPALSGAPGTIVQVGDMMLMSTSKENFEAREKAKRDKEMARMRALEEQFRAQMDTLRHPAGRRAHDIVI